MWLLFLLKRFKFLVHLLVSLFGIGKILFLNGKLTLEFNYILRELVLNWGERFLAQMIWGNWQRMLRVYF